MLYSSYIRGLGTFYLDRLYSLITLHIKSIILDVIAPYIKTTLDTDRSLEFQAHKVNLSQQPSAGNQSLWRKSVLSVRLLRSVMEGSGGDNAEPTPHPSSSLSPGAEVILKQRCVNSPPHTRHIQQYIAIQTHFSGR